MKLSLLLQNVKNCSVALGVIVLGQLNIGCDSESSDLAISDLAIKDARIVQLSEDQRNAVANATLTMKDLAYRGWEPAYESIAVESNLESAIARSMLGNEAVTENSALVEKTFDFSICAEEVRGTLALSGDLASDYILTTAVEVTATSLAESNGCTLHDINLETTTTNFRKLSRNPNMFSGSHSFKLSGRYEVKFLNEVDAVVKFNNVTGAYYVTNERIDNRFEALDASIVENGRCTGSVTVTIEGSDPEELTCAEFIKTGFDALAEIY